LTPLAAPQESKRMQNVQPTMTQKSPPLIKNATTPPKPTAIERGKLAKQSKNNNKPSQVKNNDEKKEKGGPFISVVIRKKKPVSPKESVVQKTILNGNNGPKPSTQLSPEQLKAIQENRLKALERLKQRKNL
jgi:hypothetical protein